MGFGSGLRGERKNVMSGPDGLGEIGPMEFNGV